MGCCCCTQIPAKTTITYDKIRKTLKTGDLVLFSSSGGLSSLEVKIATCSPWTHIGMIVRCKHLHKLQDDLGIWHSPAQILQFMPDVTTGEIKQGPQLNSLRPIIEASGGVVYIRKLYNRKKRNRKKRNQNYNLFYDEDEGGDNYNYNYQLGDLCDTGLMDFIRKEEPKSYEKKTRQLLLAAYDGPFGQNEEDTSSYFCSELVAETYKILGILKRNITSSEYVPKDFASTSTQELFLQKGYLLSGEYKVVTN